MYKYFTIVLLFLFSYHIKAQEFNAGVSGSLVASQLDGDWYGGYNRLGGAFGVYANRLVSDKLAIQMGVRYIHKGSSESNKNTTYSCFLQYAELPVTLRYFCWKKIDIEAGLSAGYLIKAKEKRDGYEIIDPPAFNKTDFCGIAGANYSINETLNLGLHMMYSLHFVRPFSANYNTMKSGQYNNLIMLSISYNFIVK